MFFYYIFCEDKTSNKMKRECTESENRIIKQCTADILTCPQSYAKRVKSNLLPMCLGAVVGLGLGGLIAMMLGVAVEAWIRIILMICVTLTVELFVLFGRLYDNRKKHNKIPGDMFWINGGTIIDYKGNHFSRMELIFAEDDLTDVRGIPCFIKYPALSGLHVKRGERIILVYSDTGHYIPLRVTERTQYLIPERDFWNIDELDQSTIGCIPHPSGVDLDKESCIMSEEERAAYVKKSNGIKHFGIANAIAIGGVCFLIFMIFSLIFIGLVGGEVITEAYDAAVLGAFLLITWVLLTYGFYKFLLAGNIRKLNKIQYKKKVMFHSMNGQYENFSYAKNIFVYEYVNGILELVPYPVGNMVFVPKDIPYGKILYKYSIEKNSCPTDLNYFMVKE